MSSNIIKKNFVNQVRNKRSLLVFEELLTSLIFRQAELRDLLQSLDIAEQTSMSRKYVHVASLLAKDFEQLLGLMAFGNRVRYHNLQPI